jgi:DNA gyrase/topoisomerase IV subunit A
MGDWLQSVQLWGAIGAALLLVGVAIAAYKTNQISTRDIKVAREEAKNAQDETDRVEKRLREEEERGQHLAEELEQEKRETAALREQAKPRILSETQLQNLIERLAPLRGRGVQMSSSSDAEAKDYFAQIKNAFVEAGVVVGGTGMRVVAVLGGPQPIEPRGIVLKVQDVTAPPKEMVVVSEAFKAAVIPYRFQASQYTEIFIGAKPTPVR